MKPIYFPYTCLPAKAMESLAIFFRQVIAYQPSDLPLPAESDALVQAGRLNFRVPVAAASDNIEQIIKAYQTWARQHQGAEFSYFKMRQGAIPFYDDASIHQIRTEIRRTQQADDRASEPADEAAQQLMQARVFLHLAQEFDSQNQAISHSLNSQADMERDMLQRLQGETDTGEARLLSTKVLGADQTGEYMIDERLAAWRTLALQDPELTGVFVTDSRPAVEAVLDDRSEVVEIGHWQCPAEQSSEHQPDWQSIFEQYLDRLVKETGPISMPEQAILPPGASEGAGARLIVYLVPDVTPYEFWRGSATPPTSTVRQAPAAERYRNTVVALITQGGQAVKS